MRNANSNSISSHQSQIPSEISVFHLEVINQPERCLQRKTDARCSERASVGAGGCWLISGSEAEDAADGDTGSSGVVVRVGHHFVVAGHPGLHFAVFVFSGVPHSGHAFGFDENTINVSVMTTIFVACGDHNGVVMSSRHKDTFDGRVVVAGHPDAVLRGVRYTTTEVDMDASAVSRVMAGFLMSTIIMGCVTRVSRLRRWPGHGRSITAVGLVLTLIPNHVFLFGRLAIHVRAIAGPLCLHWAGDKCDGEQGGRGKGDFDDALRLFHDETPVCVAGELCRRHADARFFFVSADLLLSARHTSNTHTYGIGLRSLQKLRQRVGIDWETGFDVNPGGGGGWASLVGGQPFAV